MNYEELTLRCVHYKITLEQFLTLYLIKGHKTETIRLYARAFPFKNGAFLDDKQKQDLINRNFLVKTEKGYTLGTAFDEVFINKDSAGEQLWEAYPGFMKGNDGRLIPLATMGVTEVSHIYWHAINGVRKEHEEVLLDVAYAIENNMLTFGIRKFLETGYWKKFRELRLGTAPSITAPSNYSKDDF